MSLQAVLRFPNAIARKRIAGAAHITVPTRRPGRSVTCAAAVWCLLLAAGATWLPAQTVSLKTFASDPYDSFTNMIQASDGNFYAVSDSFGLGAAAIATGCPDGSANDCDFITKITPDGTVTILHTFEQDPKTDASDGFGPSSLIEAPDGMLYGTTVAGGPAGYGTIFRVSTSGVFTTLYAFPADGTGNDPQAPSPGAPNGVTPGPLVLGNDGNFYGTSQGTLGGVGFFQLSPSGVFTMLHAPDQKEVQYHDIQPLVQADDGNFYAATGSYIVRITPQGAVSTIYTAPADGSGGGNGVLVEGADQNLYGTVYSGYDASGMDNGQGFVYKVSTAGAYRQLYKFTGGVDGYNVNSELTVGSDGSLYGTTYYGGNTLECNDSGPGCGTIFTISPTTGFTSLYKFSYDPNDGQRPYGRMLQGADGNFIGSFNSDAPTNNSAFKLSVQPALQAPVQITFDPKTVNPKETTTLTWSVLNAFSATMQQCHASILNASTGASAGAGVWNGPQPGTLKSGVYTGNTTITPTASGTYTYVLNCGGIETGMGTLIVGNGPTITTASLPNASVSKTFATLVQAIGGTSPYHWGTLGPLPPGVSIDAISGTLGGSPTQFGTYQVGVNVQDSATPPQSNSAVLQLTIDSSLILSSALKSANVGQPYSQALPANGGYGAYKFTIISGKLPDGLALNASSGVISGTPTTGGDSLFSVTLTDGENPAAKVTQAFKLSTIVPPLSVTYGQFPDCTVMVLCEGQLAATGGVPPYTWTIAPGATFPAGLTLDPDGGFTGKPLQSRESYRYDLEVQVTDSANPPVIDTGVDLLKIVSGLKIVSITLPVATVGMPYAAPAPVATGGLPPYKWGIGVLGDPTVVVTEFGNKGDGALYSPGPVTPGTHTLIYYLTDSEGTPETETQQATLSVVLPTLPTSTSLSTSNSLAGTGMSVTLTAKVSKGGSAPTGIVVFSNGPTVLGTVTLDTTGTATLSTSFSSAGTYNLTATYSGDASSTGSVSAPLVETVVTPSISAAVSPGTLTLTSGQPGTILITLTPTGGYTGPVTFSCGQLPPHISCTFAPPSLTITAVATSVSDTLTINTAAPTLAALEMPASTNGGSVLAALTLWLPASILVLFGLRRKAAPFPRLLVLCVLTLSLAGVVTVSGCGSSSPNIDASPGTYNIPVNLTIAGGMTQAVTATVIVK